MLVEPDQGQVLPVDLRLLALARRRVDERDVVHGHAGVGHRLVGERLHLGLAPQVDDRAHAALLDEVRHVLVARVGERVAAEDAPLAQGAAGHGAPTEVTEVDEAGELRGPLEIAHRAEDYSVPQLPSARCASW